jgi:signal transduction histidine kinase/ActR/RegA family two-component response regulator
MRLRRALFALAAATILPILGIAVLAAALVIQQKNDNLVSVAKTRNRATLAAVDAELRGAIGTLQAIGEVRELQVGDIRSFHQYAQVVLRSHSSWQNVLLHDADGHQLANARLPWNAELLYKPVESRTFDALRQGHPAAITDLVAAPLLNQELGISVRVPVLRDGKLAYVLTAVLKPRAFQALIEQQDLPRSWVSGLVDSQGRLIARFPPVPPGAFASEQYREHVREASEGWYRGRTLEGDDTYTAFLRSSLTGWSIGFAIPSQAVLGDPLRTFWLMSAGLAVSLLAAALIVAWLGRRITTPMGELAQAASALGSGSVPRAVASRIDEVGRVSASLTAAAQAIAERDRQLRETETELRQQAAHLMRADANKRRFLDVLGHELRNPLAPLRNGLAILKKAKDDQNRADVQAMMERQIGQMTRLIDDLLDVNRIDRGQLELRREHVSMDSVVRSAVEIAKPLINGRQQMLEVRQGPAPLYVDGDLVRLSQVLSNLLNNASKFSPNGARITLDVCEDEGSAVVTVTDLGRGFDRTDGSKIFDPFLQLEARDGSPSGGLGIGLTIAKSIVELHGGTIQAESDGPGRGARFTVRLPAVPPPALQREAKTDAALPVPKRKVLVVDDNVDAANSLAEFLGLEGYEVQIAYSGSQAQDAACRVHPEVAFIDLNMPGMGGAELAGALHAQPWAGQLRLYALTGMGQKADVEASLLSGFDGHLTKPASPDAVLRLAAGVTDNVIPLRGDRHGP